MKRRLLISCVVLIFFSRLNAQDYYWWANNVNYDGITSWSDYLIFSPKYMGPNALPIPNFSDGLVENENFVLISGSTHFSQEDNTYNPNIYANFNLVKDIITFDIYYLPIEYFNMSHQVKTERKTFYYFYNKKSAYGDTYFNTNIQLLKRQSFNLRLRVGYKFPTSGQIGMARFTDKPGYYFDLNFGKRYFLTNDLYLSINGMLGFYVWETNSDFQYQNDAPLYGFGLSLKNNRIYSIGTGIRGYYGYMKNGDRPLVWKTNLSRRINNIDFSFSYQIGLHDTKYHSFELGIGYIFNKPDKEKNKE